MKKRVFSLSVAIASLMTAPGAVLANDFVVGQSSNLNVTLNTNVQWIVVRQATVVIPGGDAAAHGCVATASADMGIGAAALGAENQYLFVLARNNPNPLLNTGSERLLELVNNGGGVNDPDSKPVATTQHFTNLTNWNGAGGGGSHTFYLLGRKVLAAHVDADVLDASLSVMCVDTP